MTTRKKLESFGNSLWCEAIRLLEDGANYHRLNGIACLLTYYAEDILKDGESANDLLELSHKIYDRLDSFGFYDNIK